MLKREWGAESNGKLLHIFIPRKTAILIPAFAVKDLSMSRKHDDDDDDGLENVMFLIMC